ncbi:MAG: hypothetical protein RBS80_20340 [Thermoguttaceae bacterium]|nr:hypothetical protein [Thermoguttaceae bacterium]
MYSTYRLNANELSGDFVKAVKTTYGKRKIEIIIREIEDETGIEKVPGTEKETRLFASRSRCGKSLGPSASPREGEA